VSVLGRIVVGEQLSDSQGPCLGKPEILTVFKRNSVSCCSACSDIGRSWGSGCSHTNPDCLNYVYWPTVVS
jgi:hypothetical protein